MKGSKRAGGYCISWYGASPRMAFNPDSPSLVQVTLSCRSRVGRAEASELTCLNDALLTIGKGEIIVDGVYCVTDVLTRFIG